MKKIFLLIFMIACSLPLFSQNSLTLETVCASLSAKQNTTGDFTQTKTIQTNSRKLKSTGKYIICPEGILWRTEKPVAASLILTKDSMIQIAANGNKNVMDGKDNLIFQNISETLSSVFSGDVAALKKNFNCKFETKEAGNWLVKLEPVDSTIASVMNVLELSGCWSEKNKAEMTKLIMTEASGNTISYEFINQKYPEELSKDERQNFIFE